MAHRKKGKGRKAQGPAAGRDDAPPPEPPARSSAPRRRWRLGTVLGLGVVVALAVGAVLVYSGVVSFPSRQLAFPPPQTPPPVRIAFEDFAGAESCRECHEDQYRAWSGSTHGRAGGVPSTEVVIAPFDGVPIRFADALVTPAVDAQGRYTFTVEPDGGDPQLLVVEGVVGGGHMVGGGTQGFVSRFDDGTIRFLPFDFIRQEGVWFCNTNTRTDEGWIPITDDMTLAECADWPPIRLLGTEEHYANCQECHTALTDLAFDDDAGAYETRVLSYAIQCESCHGPMREHNARADSTRIASEDDLAVEALELRDEDGSLRVCFRCHALKDVVRPGYLPGMPLEDYYSVGLPMLGARPLHVDGRIRTFAYQGNHLYSDCYLNGSMTCVDCHDPHTQEYRDIWGRPLEDRFADEQCTDCHASKAERPEEHTFHRPGTVGSRCVDCHMPYLQHPELGSSLRFARSDHTIPIPRPGVDDAQGIVNACALSGCHAEAPFDTIMSWTRRLWGELKPRKPVIEALANPFQIGDLKAGVEVLLGPGAEHAAAQIPALELFVSRYLTPDMRRLDDAAEEALLRLAESPDLDVRGVALAALHLARGESRDTRRFLVESLERAGDEEPPVRRRWAMALGTFADRYFQRSDWDNAVTVYRKALDLMPGDAATLRNLGLAQANAGDFTPAVEALTASVDAEPRDPLAWVNLGFALEGTGDLAGAEDAYRRAVAITDDEPLAHFNLGNVLIRRSDPVGAARHYERALELRPTMAEAYLNLVRAYGAVQDSTRVLATARRWQRWVPTDPQPSQLIRQLEPLLGGR